MAYGGNNESTIGELFAEIYRMLQELDRVEYPKAVKFVRRYPSVNFQLPPFYCPVELIFTPTLRRINEIWRLPTGKTYHCEKYLVYVPFLVFKKGEFNYRAVELPANFKEKIYE